MKCLGAARVGAKLQKKGLTHVAGKCIFPLLICCDLVCSVEHENDQSSDQDIGDQDVLEEEIGDKYIGREGWKQGRL